MSDKRISELTEALKSRESFLSYYVWKSGKEYGITLSRMQIEDIIGDAYLKAATKLQNDEILKIDYYLAWFVRILFLTTMNAIRKEGIAKKTIDINEIKNLHVSNFIYETFDRNYRDPFFKSLLEKNLNRQEYELLKLNIEGYTNEEIANHFQMTQENVRQIRHRAIQKLKKIFQ